MKSQHIGDVQWNSEGTISLIPPVKGDYIKTYTGKRFVPKEPDVDKIDIRDIAHALSLICRGNGHVKTFFSVAQHCIFCAREAEARGYSANVKHFFPRYGKQNFLSTVTSFFMPR